VGISEKFYSYRIKGILVNYKGNWIYCYKLEGRPDIVKVSFIWFEKGSKEFVDFNPLKVLDIPNLLDNSMDHSFPLKH